MSWVKESLDDEPEPQEREFTGPPVDDLPALCHCCHLPVSARSRLGRFQRYCYCPVSRVLARYEFEQAILQRMMGPE